MKRLIVCCDGTWQNVGTTFPTNVAKIAAAVKPVGDDGIVQIVYYSAGIGTNGITNKLFGGGFGKGIDFNIKDAYRFLCLNYQPGDEVYLFGFSRGAYTVRSLAGLINNSGLLRAEHIDKINKDQKQIGAYELYRSRKNIHKPGSIYSREFRKKYCVHVDCCTGRYEGRIPITLLACWDTVGSLGLPPIGIFNIKKYFPLWLLKKFPGRYRFHDTSLSKIIINALHAVSVDERRIIFDVTLMSKNGEKEKNGEVITVTNQIQKLQQTWFCGDHGSIGGGIQDLQPLSDNVLLWMIKRIEDLNLQLSLDMNRIPFSPDKSKLDPTINFNHFDLLNISPKKWRKINSDTVFETEIDKSVKLRWMLLPTYRPDNLVKKFGHEFDEWGRAAENEEL